MLALAESHLRVEIMASSIKSRLPPGVDSNRWAISGMCRLGRRAFLGGCVDAGKRTGPVVISTRSPGSPLAAKQALHLEALAQSGDDRARALAGRLWLAHWDATYMPLRMLSRQSSRRQSRFTPGSDRAG